MNYYNEKFMTYQGKNFKSFVYQFTDEEIEEMKATIEDFCGVEHDIEDKDGIVMDILSAWIADNVFNRCANAETAQLFNLYMNIV